VVGSVLPSVDGLWRGRAERANGRLGILEAGVFEGRSIHAWLDAFVEDIEQWGDTGAYLPVLAGGRVGDTKVVVRIVQPAKGQPIASFAGRTLQLDRVVVAAESMASAIAAAHARGLVHGALTADRVYLLPNGVEIEPGGLRAALDADLGRSPPSRSDDVKAVAELMCELLPKSGLPDSLEALLHHAMNPSASARPTAAELVGLLRQVAMQLSPMGAGEAGTPSTANRTVAPRLGVVDVTLPPAPPPAPELRSMVPVQERATMPTLQKEKVTRTMEIVVSVSVLVFSLFVLWWMLA
jgi:hypothetical protein